MLYDNSDDMYKSKTSERRISRHKRTGSDGQNSESAGTLSGAVSNFLTAVNDMNETVMVPCRLLDIEMKKSNENKIVPELLQSGQDAYAIYSLLNSTKNDLMYGLTSPIDEDEENFKKQQSESTDSWHSLSTSRVNSSKQQSNNNNNQSRKSSSISLMSLGSSSSSSDSGMESDITEETSEDGESCISSEESGPNTVAQASAELRLHLSGLHSCLSQLSSTALFITDRYQEELGQE